VGQKMPKREKGKGEATPSQGWHVLPMLLLLMPQVSYHCKNGCDYGSPDPVDILRASCSGLCLAAIINIAFVVLTYPPVRQTHQQSNSARGRLSQSRP
jgi:hypothetical protein